MASWVYENGQIVELVRSLDPERFFASGIEQDDVDRKTGFSLTAFSIGPSSDEILKLSFRSEPKRDEAVTAVASADDPVFFGRAELCLDASRIDYIYARTFHDLLALVAFLRPTVELARTSGIDHQMLQPLIDAIQQVADHQTPDAKNDDSQTRLLRTAVGRAIGRLP